MTLSSLWTRTRVGYVWFTSVRTMARCRTLTLEDSGGFDGGEISLWCLLPGECSQF